MDMLEIIAAKRDGKVLTGEQIRYFVKGYTEGSIPDYQASALLMAIYFNNMNQEEILKLQFLLLFYGTQEDAGVFFNSDIVDIRILLSKCGDELSFSHADFDMDGVLVAKKFVPSSFVLLRLVYNEFVLCDKFTGTGDVS